MPTDPGLDTLMTKIEHIVVLMLENRSFDHMLGYLSLEGGRGDIDGLRGNESNINSDGKSYRIRHLTEDPADRDPDPCHSGECVARQLSNNNGGFVADYALHHHDPDPGRVMGYYNARDLPIYDYLAREFSICDRWFSSVPGQTWPNRLYALSGGAEGSKDNAIFPIYHRSSFLRYLRDDPRVWRWYSHDMATLRVIDPEYFIGHYDHFYHFNSPGPSYRMQSMQGPETFLNHVASGNLAAVSWIDPNFTGVLGSPSLANDDHAPCDVRAGQYLVGTVCDALFRGPQQQWQKTLLIIVYDEHGGFYDHVPPPPVLDNDPRFSSYGARVPAFIVSPWIAPGQVSHVVFDHTSIIKTILLRFCPQAISDMGTRVANANHLGSVLTPFARGPVPAVPPPPAVPWGPQGSASQRPTEFQRGLLNVREASNREKWRLHRVDGEQP